MHRKVIQQGPSTLMVSLPSKWAKEHGVRKGADISLDIVDSQLVISTEKIDIEKKATLAFRKKEDYWDRMLIGKYRDGYNEVVITFDDPGVMENIRETLRYLLGFEIVDQTPRTCTIRNISEGSEENYDVLFRRLFLLVLTASEACLEYAHSKEEKHLKTAVEIRETIIKLEQLCLRILNKQRSKSLEFFYVWNVGAFGRIWTSLAMGCLTKKSVFTARDLRFFRDTVGYMRCLYDTFYARTADNMKTLTQQLLALRPEGAALLDVSRNRLVIFYLLRIINRAFEVSMAY